MKAVSRKILQLSVLMLALLLFGTLGYSVIEGWRWFDGLYMTIITLATIGYGETHPLSDAGRAFTMLLILFGSGGALYAIAALTGLVLEGKLIAEWRQTRMQKAVDQLEQHYVICGFGSTGRYVVEELAKTDHAFVVIENEPAKLRELKEAHRLCVEGDATHEDSLQRAGIERAAGLIACLHTDADNVFVVLTARELNRKLRIVAKAIDETSQRKLRAVGADGVVLPNFIGGLRLVMELVRPNAITLLDMMLHSGKQSILTEELELPHDSRWLGRNVGALGFAGRSGVSLVALQRAGEREYRFNPPQDTLLASGDVLILMGETKAVRAATSDLVRD